MHTKQYMLRHQFGILDFGNKSKYVKNEFIEHRKRKTSLVQKTTTISKNKKTIKIVIFKLSCITLEAKK